MPKIDPNLLLGCLHQFLGINGGIKSEADVIQLVSLMTKFSKNLVSKCIYILILKHTEPDLLVKFMAKGGWALVFQWLDEGICKNNFPLIREILELLLKCPISLDRLKENNCPKVVKGLSKDSECEEVKRLAGKLVEQWLKFIKSGQAAISDVAMASVSTPITVLPSNAVVSTVHLNSTSNAEGKKPTLTRKITAKSGIPVVHKVATENEEEETEEDEVVPPIGTLPLYKITVRDGKRVLEKVDMKALTLPVKKTTDNNEVESSGVTSVVLKSDPVTKKFRYVAKPVSEKEKSDASEHNSEDKSNIQKSVSLSSDSLSKPKIVVLSEKTDVKKLEDTKTEKTSENKTKNVNLKSLKDGSKSKDNQIKISKSSKDNENCKSESKHKDKDKKSSRDSDKDKKKSEHKSHKTDKSRDRDRDRDRDREKDKDKDKEKAKKKEKESSKEKHKDGERERDKDKHNKDKESKTEKVLSASEKAQIQADKDKNTLERLKTPAISLLGKIPKKTSSQTASSSDKTVSSPVNKTSESSEDSVGEGKKISEPRTPKVRPKTVKTFNSKFRSTGLEEEIKPPPSRSTIKKKLEEKRPLLPKPDPSKSSTTGTKDGAPPEKKPKIAEIALDVKKDKVLEKAGGIKLIPPKPKPALLESDMFSDALTASTKMEPRKRKRRTSSSKEAPEPKKEVKEENSTTTPPEATSPKDVKPALKFYRDTLEDDEEKNKENAIEVKGKYLKSFFWPGSGLKDPSFKTTPGTCSSKLKGFCPAAEPKAESDSEDSSKQTSSGESQDGGKPVSKLYPNGVLVCKTKKGPKKTVKWKEDSELTSVRLFELDETERVNVTRTFVDMKLMERTHEREAFQLARKLGKGFESRGRKRDSMKGERKKCNGDLFTATEDVMEERIPWGPLYEVEVPPDRKPAVEPGKSSLEKNVQYAREKTVLQAIYFHRNLIPDSPAEPDPEVHPTTDPKIIPLDDITGNSDSICNFQNIPWPEPKPALVPSSPPPGQQMGSHNQQLSTQGQHSQGFPSGYSSAGNFPGFPQMGMPGMMPPGQGNWRPGDGKDMGMNMAFQPNGPLCPQMGQPPNMFNPGGGPEGFMNGPPMGGFNPGFPMPCDPSMYGPPMRPMGMGGPPPGQWNRGGGWQGARPFMGPMNMQQKFQKGVCHHFAKFGNCARGSSCRFMHPN